MLSGVEIANFKALDPYVTLALNSYNIFGGCEMRCVKNRHFAEIASKSEHESIGRVAGVVDAHQFFVDSATYIDGAAGMLVVSAAC